MNEKTLSLEDRLAELATKAEAIGSVAFAISNTCANITYDNLWSNVLCGISSMSEQLVNEIMELIDDTAGLEVRKA